MSQQSLKGSPTCVIKIQNYIHFKISVFIKKRERERVNLNLKRSLFFKVF